MHNCGIITQKKYEIIHYSRYNHTVNKGTYKTSYLCSENNHTKKVTTNISILIKIELFININTTILAPEYIITCVLYLHGITKSSMYCFIPSYNMPDKERQHNNK